MPMFSRCNVRPREVWHRSESLGSTHSEFTLTNDSVCSAASPPGNVCPSDKVHLRRSYLSFISAVN
ncbi:hypothetical protein EYF80_028132 [Liparis tanakae]|uniref:Uncharacterized protein n=1 Tax=Liparis tanakae TaxID=230148 RepID=A0A4Z2H6T0_9TELE|nr:hypothetical protein EYF80_028132 [Liparis tanakae]